MTRRLVVSGIVQGVGFRYFIYKKAQELNLTGYAKNCEDGKVEIVVQGDELQISKLIEEAKKGPRFSKVESVDISDIKITNNYFGFRILD